MIREMLEELGLVSRKPSIWRRLGEFAQTPVGAASAAAGAATVGAYLSEVVGSDFFQRFQESLQKRQEAGAEPPKKPCRTCDSSSDNAFDSSDLPTVSMPLSLIIQRLDELEELGPISAAVKKMFNSHGPVVVELTFFEAVQLMCLTRTEQLPQPKPSEMELNAIPTHWSYESSEGASMLGTSVQVETVNLLQNLAGALDSRSDNDQGEALAILSASYAFYGVLKVVRIVSRLEKDGLSKREAFPLAIALLTREYPNHDWKSSIDSAYGSRTDRQPLAELAEFDWSAKTSVVKQGRRHTGFDLLMNYGVTQLDEDIFGQRWSDKYRTFLLTAQPEPGPES